MTKISLVEVPLTKTTLTLNGVEEIYSAIRTNYPKASLLNVAGFLRDLGDVYMIDMKIREPKTSTLYKQIPYGEGTVNCYRVGASFESVNKEIESSDIISLTSNFTRASSMVTDFMKYAKSVNLDSTIVVGGSDATPRFDYYLANGADIVVLGEGEYIGRRVVESIDEGKQMENISGIAYKDEGHVKYNPRNPKTDIVNMDDVPLPAFNLVDKDERKKWNEAIAPLPDGVETPLGMLETSRGCTQKCTFCTTPSKGPYRYMSTQRIEELLEHYKKYGINTVALMEDNILSRLNFQGGREKIFEMFELLQNYGFAYEFGNGLEIGKLVHNGVTDNELINALLSHDIDSKKVVGAYRVYVPMESLHIHPEKVHRKLKPYSEELKVIESMASAGVPMMAFGVILGRPDETKSTVELTEKRCREIKNLAEKYGTQTYFTHFLNILLPGTADYERYRHLVTYDITKEPELFQMHTATMKTTDFEPEEVTQLRRTMEERINGKETLEKWALIGMKEKEHAERVRERE